MKNILYILAILFSFSTKAQEVIKVLNTDTFDLNNPDEIVYFKDTNNALDKYTGDWLYDDGTHYLKITVTKKLHASYNQYFTDELSINFLYKNNGITIYDNYGLAPKYIFGSSLDIKNIWGMIQIGDGISLVYSEPSTNNSCGRARSTDLILECLTGVR